MARTLSAGDKRRPQLVNRVVDVVHRARLDWRRAPRVLEEALRDLRQLHSVERRFVGEAIFGMVRWQRRIEKLVGAADTTSAYFHWLDHLAEDQALRSVDAATDQALSRGERWSFPDWIVGEAERAVGAGPEADRLLAALNQRAPLVARANRLKGDRDALVAALAQEQIETRPVALAPDALELLSHHNVYGLAAFKQGLFELQDTGSQLICELVAPPPGGFVVDACAGAGGKSLALAAQLGNKGRIVALDVGEDKLVELRRRARRAGVTNLEAHRVRSAEPLVGLERFFDRADRVLVDAPCTGLGVLRRHPEARWRIGAHEVAELAAEQLRLLSIYQRFVKPGGRLVYATCSLSPTENEEVVARFVAAHPEWVVVTSADVLSRARAEAIGDGTYLRVLPHTHGTDGFFAAVLRRQGSGAKSG